MRILIWIVSGIVAGWLSRVLMKSRAYGVLGDLILGSLGALVGGWILRSFGAEQPAGHWDNFAAAVIGAMALLGSMRLLLRLSKQTGLYRPHSHGSAGAILDLETHVKRLGELERRIVTRVLRRETVAVNANQVFDAQLTFGQRVADRVASFGGSWTFIGLFLLFMLVWMMFNTETTRHWDPYPFILLNLILSCLAALQAPIIMMSQNRQTAKDRIEVQQDYEVNLRAEMEIMALHAKIDQLREVEIGAMRELQQRQVEVLERLERILAR